MAAGAWLLICREATALSVRWGPAGAGVEGVLRKIVTSITLRGWTVEQAVNHPP